MHQAVPSSSKYNICKYCKNNASDAIDYRCHGPCRKLVHLPCAVKTYQVHMTMSCNPNKFYCISCSIDKLKESNIDFSKINISSSENFDLSGAASAFCALITRKLQDMKSCDIDTPGPSKISYPIPLKTNTSTYVKSGTKTPDTKDLANQTCFTEHGTQGYAHFKKCIEEWTEMWYEINKCTLLLQQYSELKVKMLAQAFNRCQNNIDKLKTLETELNTGLQNSEKMNMLIQKEVKALQDQCQKTSKHIADLKDKLL